MLSNTDVAELLARQAERESGILSRAFRRAARSAFLWPEEVTAVAAQNRSLTELRAIGPFIERQIQRWIDKHARLRQTVPAIRKDFISLAEARQLLTRKKACDESKVHLSTNRADETNVTGRRIKRALAVRILLWAALLLPIVILIFLLRGCT